MASLPETKHEAADTLPDAWDYKGRPALRSSSGGWTCAAMILGAEGCERLTTLGIAVNLVTYLTNTMHLGNAVSANTVTNFLGTSFMLCLLGGFLADTFLGRYLTIAIFVIVQATQSNIYIDQFDEFDEKEKKQMIKFFNWFFFFISIGALLAVTVLVYIQDNIGREWGYGICVGAIVVGLVVFLSGTTRYRFKKLVGSPLTQIASVVVAAWRKRRLPLPSDSSLLFDVDDEGPSLKKQLKQKLPHSKQFRFLDKAAIKDPDAPTTKSTNKWYISTLTDVEEVKLVIRMIPIWATTIMFWTVYAQMTTFSVSQATTMDRRIGTFHIPSASLTVFFVATILLTVALYDFFISPLCTKLLKNPQGLTPLQRIGVGLVLSIFAMIAAALFEIKRLNATTSTSTLSVFWLVPQFVLVGSGEAFTYMGQLDFFLRECPKGMKTMSTGLFLTTLSLGFFVSSILVSIVDKVTGKEKPWLADDLNKGRLYNFYWLLAILSLLNLGLFLVCARGYVYKEKRLAEVGIQLEENQPTGH